MTISRDLLFAILSMDAYNRGYGAGLTDEISVDVDGLGLQGVGGGAVNIGPTTIISDSSVLLDDDGNRLDQPAGFYAVAYELDDGTTVVSYRGTDDFADELLYVDFPIIYGSSFHQDQIVLAQQFFNSVRDAATGPIVLTGYSLGAHWPELRRRRRTWARSSLTQSTTTTP